jgi:hypothetical protein
MSVRLQVDDSLHMNAGEMRFASVILSLFYDDIESCSRACCSRWGRVRSDSAAFFERILYVVFPSSMTLGWVVGPRTST